MDDQPTIRVKGDYGTYRTDKFDIQMQFLFIEAFISLASVLPSILVVLSCHDRLLCLTRVFRRPQKWLHGKWRVL